MFDLEMQYTWEKGRKVSYVAEKSRIFEARTRILFPGVRSVATSHI